MRKYASTIVLVIILLAMSEAIAAGHKGSQKDIKVIVNECMRDSGGTFDITYRRWRLPENLQIQFNDCVARRTREQRR